VLSVEDWAEIRRLHRAERMPIKQIARVMGCSKNTVKRALGGDGPPRYERVPRGSIVDPVEPRIRELLQAWPTMPATVIAERIGWTRSLTVLKDRIRELRPVYLPADPASRTAYAAGEIAQCDLWFPPITLSGGFGQTRTATRLPVLVMVTGYARWLAARLIPSRVAEDPFAGWWELIAGLGAVPRVLVWDGEGAVGQRRRRTTVLTEAAHAFRGVLGARSGSAIPVIRRPRGWWSGPTAIWRPRSCPAGPSPVRPTSTPSSATGSRSSTSAPVGCWAVRRRIGSRPTGPRCCRCHPVAPPTGWQASLRLPRDHYVRLDADDYSVHPAAVGRRVELRADLERVQAFCDGRLVADHARCWARHQTISDPGHLQAAARLRQQRAALGPAVRAGAPRRSSCAC